VGLVYARTRSFSSRGDEGETIHRFTGRPLPEGRILQVLLEQGCLIPLPSAMIRRDAWEKVGPIPSHLKFAEDYWLFAAIAEYFEVRCVQTACCFYRVHPESETARNRVLSHIESLEVLERWRYQLTPAAYRRRRRICHTLWATEMVRKERRVWAGLTKLTRDGSLPFLLRGCCSVAIRQFLLNRRPVS
jgi:GT2 family glycosyltransferase